MWGRVAIVAIVLTAAAAGLALWWLQVFAFYHEVEGDGETDVALTLLDGGVEPILYDNFRAIDSDSSPIRYRACFETPQSLPLLTETYQVFEAAEPLVAPVWFDCFDAARIGDALATGEAVAFLGQRNVEWGVDRVVAIYPDGRGYAWQQLNECGEKSYDGTPLGEECPPRPAAAD